MLGLLLWAIILIIIAACLAPWWFIPSVVIMAVLGMFANSVKK